MLETKQRTPRASARHPLLIGRDPSTWHPDLVGLIPGYAATEAGFKRRQEAARAHMANLNATGKRGSRRGVPDGFAGQRSEVAAVREQVGQAAAEALDLITDGGGAERTKRRRSAAANAALEETVAAMIDSTRTTRDRLKAAAAVLKLVGTKPVQVVERTLIMPDNLHA